MCKVFYLTWSSSKVVAQMKPFDVLFPEAVQKIMTDQRINFELFLDIEITHDYLNNNCPLPVVSPKMKQLIDENTTEKDGIIWLDIVVNTPTRKLIFHLLTLTIFNEVLDKSKTIYVANTDHVVKPVFDVNLISDINVFTKGNSFNWQMPSSVFITDRLKKAIQKAKLTGVKFEQIATNQQ
jgi:hypothetical protein